MVVLESKNLNKTFFVDPPLYKQVLSPFAKKQRVKALVSISLSIESGNILGIVGPNGAGKTTLLRILADILDADEGKISICGQRMNKNSFEIRSKIGYVSSDERSFFWRLTGRENLEFFARLYGIGKAQATIRIEELLNQFNLMKKSIQLFRDYSTGTRKKFSLVRALIHRPKVLLLDEVTNSLDTISTERVKLLVREYISHHPGCCAIWSTHRFEEVYEICDKILVIERGQGKFMGSPLELKKVEHEIFHINDNNEKLLYGMNNTLGDS